MRQQVKSSLKRNCISKVENKSKDFERISLSRPTYDAAKKDVLRFLKTLCNDAIESIKD